MNVYILLMYNANMSQEIVKGIFLHHCLRCEFNWTSKAASPGSCANQKCRSPYLNKERIR